ncbi:MAG: UDP-N-acetylmuramoyl-L-alanine--D-glutamate ligase [Oscillospiraceae bacterium]|jgi:UDP-N-acetylmuramoylalanine--D-glutamate ligase|nr:UDP-N-acetylmuramoyl-L-alanine--D-glutamate ligase [Oscillospiraceae bacterium]
MSETFLKKLNGKTIALVGIGTSNLPLIGLFKKYGATVIACDSKTESELGENAAKAKSAGAVLNLGKDYLQNLQCDIILRTPGMRYYSDELNNFRAKGIVVTSEMELFFDLCPCKIIAVTGSDGKTTTTTIISEFLKKAGYTVHLGGNIGTPLLPIIESINPEDFAVVELSSFQLISMRQSPDIAVVTNLSPNHLDIHKDMQEYTDSKKNIFLHQNAFGKTVLNLDDDITSEFAKEARGNVLYFSRKQNVNNGTFLKDDTIYFADNGTITPVIKTADIKIPGWHNTENYMAAICAVWGLVTPQVIAQVAKEFAGVEHRAEFVAEVDGVKYYNDSIASSPTRTASGTLSLYKQKIILIAGGYDKKISYKLLGPVICNKVKTLIIMGNTAPKIKEATLTADNYSPDNPKIMEVSNMEEAVLAARQNAIEGDIVSLSPASASFDLYKNFDARGKHFKQLVLELKENNK